MKVIMKVIPARSRELHIVLQIWNESNWDGVGQSCPTPHDRYAQLTNLFTDVPVMIVSDVGYFENKGKFTFV